ncbi:hypothetical protein BJV82DRAFT_625334 [Fennellomyces sp. T-0311]|nr:hypothetical protein BJV82DRAFT_625334 [Fennellomyces sp. T-0311]
MKLTCIATVALLLTLLQTDMAAARACRASSNQQSSLRRCCQNKGGISGLDYKRQEGACHISPYFCTPHVQGEQAGENYLRSCASASSLSCS